MTMRESTLLRIHLVVLWYLLWLCCYGCVAQESEIISLVCPEYNSCIDCLSSNDENCNGWGAGECLRDCRVLADAPCYSIGINGSPTAVEACEMEVIDQQNNALCSSQSDCSSCVATKLNDSISTCQWFDDFEFCASGCGQIGCGTTICPTSEETVLPVVNDLIEYCDSSEFTTGTCNQCLSDPLCNGWVSGGLCLSNCTIIADVPCYSVDNVDPISISEVCEIAAQDSQNTALCSNQTNCSTCVNTIQTNGFNTCYWHENSGTCLSSQCNQFECGNTTCPITEPVQDVFAHCDSYTFCNECLADPRCEGWVSGVCLPNCTVIADVACYTSDSSNVENIAQVCETASEDAQNAVLCSNLNTCTECVETLQSDGVTSCYWYNSVGMCFSDACSQVGCGNTACPVIEPVDDLFAYCKSFTSCNDCLSDPLCEGWASGRCLPNCTVISVASCFSLGDSGFVTVDETCDVAVKGSRDATICSYQSSCSGCVETTQSDGSTPCYWHDAVGMCSSEECSHSGCGITACPTGDQGDQADDVLAYCNSFPTCNECLSDPLCEGWASGICLPNCTVIADVSCYLVDGSENNTIEDVCSIALDDSNNAQLCRSQTNCSTCVEMLQSDGSTCYWFEDGGVCLSEECSQIGCGNTTCTENISGTANKEATESYSSGLIGQPSGSSGVIFSRYSVLVTPIMFFVFNRF